MTIRLRDNGADLPVGGIWTIDATVTDAEGLLTSDTLVVTVTLPDDSTAVPVATLIYSGAYRIAYVVASAGRYTARVVGAEGAADAVAFVSATTATADTPDLADVLNYLGWDEDNPTGDAAEALAAESAAQRRVCKIKAVYPADLRNALFRRVARNLAMKGIPLAVLRGDAESGNTVLPGADPVVRRLEAGHRRLVTG